MNNIVPSWNGERLDPVSGVAHLGNGYRAYHPGLMRFHCPDNLSPFGAGGINPYAYGTGDQINRADPSGHLSWQAWTGIGLGMAGLALAAFTAGTSIVASGGVIATLESASAISLAIGAASVAADVAAIASGATEESDPRASAVLAWVSLGSGVAAMAPAAAGLGRTLTAGLRQRLKILLDHGLSGRGAKRRGVLMAAESSSATHAVHQLPLEIQNKIITRLDIRSLDILRQSGDSPASALAQAHASSIATTIEQARLASVQNTSAFLNGVSCLTVEQVYTKLGGLRQLGQRLPMRGYTEWAIREVYHQMMIRLPAELSDPFRKIDQTFIDLEDIVPPNPHLGEIFQHDRELPIPSLPPSVPDDFWGRL